MTRERATWLTSALAAIAILGAAVTAQPSRTSSGDRLARMESDLRYQLELGARLDRIAFESRRQQLDDALAAWRESPQTPHEYQLMTEWLRTAILRSLPGETGELPPAPTFGAAKHEARKEVAEEKVQQQATKARKPASVTEAEKSVVQSPRRTEATPQASAAKPHERVAQPQPSDVAPQAIQPAVQAPEKVEPFIVRISDPVPTGAVELPGLPDQPPAAEVAARQAPTPVQTAGVYEESPAEATAPKPQAALQAGTRVQVNLSELNARIRGYHDELREIEGTVVASRKEMSVGEVAMLVGRLESLSGQYQFVRLYYDALSDEEQQFVRAPKPMDVTIKLVHQQRALSEALDVEDHFSAADAAGESELAKRLDALAELVGEEKSSAECCGGDKK